MDVFLMIRRKKTTMFLDAKENTTVAELKKMIEGITKQPPNQQRLYNHDDTVSESLAHLCIFIDFELIEVARSNSLICNRDGIQLYRFTFET